MPLKHPVNLKLNFRGLRSVGNCFRDMSEIGEKTYMGERTVANRIVDVYHTGLVEEDRERILKELTKSESTIRLVICTVSFGLGVNIGP